MMISKTRVFIHIYSRCFTDILSIYWRYFTKGATNYLHKYHSWLQGPHCTKNLGNPGTEPKLKHRTQVCKWNQMIDGRGTTRAEDAQGTPSESCITKYSRIRKLDQISLKSYRGTSLTRKRPLQDPTVSLCLGSLGGPRGVGVSWWSRYPCIQIESDLNWMKLN